MSPCTSLRSIHVCHSAARARTAGYLAIYAGEAWLLYVPGGGVLQTVGRQPLAVRPCICSNRCYPCAVNVIPHTHIN